MHFFYYKNVEAQITLTFKNAIVILIVAISISFSDSNENYMFLQAKKKFTLQGNLGLHLFVSTFLRPTVAESADSRALWLASGPLVGLGASLPGFPVPPAGPVPQASLLGSMDCLHNPLNSLAKPYHRLSAPSGLLPQCFIQ